MREPIVTKPGLAMMFALSIVLAFPSGCARSRPDPLAPAFRVTIPAERSPFPTSLPSGQKEPGFVLRGTKGWAWTWDQYLAEIPYLARYEMNFLMSCYTSVFTDPIKFVNRWWEPLPPKTLEGIDKVARASRDAGIDPKVYLKH